MKRGTFRFRGSNNVGQTRVGKLYPWTSSATKSGSWCTGLEEEETEVRRAVVLKRKRKRKRERGAIREMFLSLFGFSRKSA